jgi:hypothetical protein
MYVCVCAPAERYDAFWWDTLPEPDSRCGLDSLLPNVNFGGCPEGRRSPGDAVALRSSGNLAVSCYTTGCGPMPVLLAVAVHLTLALSNQFFSCAHVTQKLLANTPPTEESACEILRRRRSRAVL